MTTTKSAATLELDVHSDNPMFEHPERAVLQFTQAEVTKWKALAETVKKADAYSIQLHDFRCEFFTFDVNDEGDDEWVKSDFRQEASTLFVTRNRVQWRGYEKHNQNGCVWATERTTFEKLEALLALGSKRYSMDELCDLWNKLADVPVTPDGTRTDESFVHFPTGTSLHTIWHWFEAQNPSFIVGEAGKSIGTDHPFRAVSL